VLLRNSNVPQGTFHREAKLLLFEKSTCSANTNSFFLLLLQAISVLSQAQSLFSVTFELKMLCGVVCYWFSPISLCLHDLSGVTTTSNGTQSWCLRLIVCKLSFISLLACRTSLAVLWDWFLLLLYLLSPRPLHLKRSKQVQLAQISPLPSTLPKLNIWIPKSKTC
jgi:hypothetical protein